LIKNLLARLLGLFVVHVEVCSSVRQGHLNLGNVNDIALDQQLLPSG
jgi:hypothetical protein